jgi:hypothetical protein
MTDAPAAALTTPTVGPPIPDLVNNILGGKQYISPAYWTGWALEEICHVNPWDWIAEHGRSTLKWPHRAPLIWPRLGLVAVWV